jgi:beta-lactamase class A
LHAIVGGVAVNSEKSQEMLALLKRDLNLAKVIPPAGEENQVNGFLGEGLPPNSKLYSKAGWMSRVRHDSAYIEIPDRPPYLLTIFTESPENATNRHILPWLSAKFAEAIRLSIELH